MASNERVGITLDVLPGTFAGVTAAIGGFNELVAATSQFSTAIAQSTSVVDAMTLTLGVALAGAAWESAKAFGELERGMKIVQAVSGQTSSQISVLTQEAGKFSVDFKMGIEDITAGLQTLGRAGLSNVNTQLDTMQAGLQAAKVQGMELNDALEKIVATTALLGGDLKSSSFGAQSQKLTSQILSTAMTAPIDMNDVVQTLSYSGGTAAAAGINIQNEDALYDYLGAISAFAQKGVKGSMAGTAMRAFFTKPASQDTSVVEAFNKLDMKPSDLWKDGGQAMRPVSEQIEIIHRQMEKLHMSTLDQIELWGKIVGPKMGQQMMKLDADTIKETSRDIRSTASATELANMTMDNFLSQLSELEQKAQRSWRAYGETALAWIGPIVKGISALFDILGADIDGIPIFQQVVKMGIILLISQIIQKLGAVKNLFGGIIREIREMLAHGARSKQTIEEQAASERKRLEALGLTDKQAQALVDTEGNVLKGTKLSTDAMAQFLIKLNEAVALMKELANLSRSASMSMISSISGAQFNRKWGTAGEGMKQGAWFTQHQGNMGNLTKNEFASLSLRHGINTADLLKIYDSKQFQQYAKQNQTGKYAFPTAVSLEKYLQENKKGLYDPKMNPMMGIVTSIQTDTGIIATNTNKQNANKQNIPTEEIKNNVKAKTEEIKNNSKIKDDSLVQSGKSKDEFVKDVATNTGNRVSKSVTEKANEAANKISQAATNLSTKFSQGLNAKMDKYNQGILNKTINQISDSKGRQVKAFNDPNYATSNKYIDSFNKKGISYREDNLKSSIRTQSINLPKKREEFEKTGKKATDYYTTKFSYESRKKAETYYSDWIARQEKLIRELDTISKENTSTIEKQQKIVTLLTEEIAKEEEILGKLQAEFDNYQEALSKQDALINSLEQQKSEVIKQREEAQKQLSSMKKSQATEEEIKALKKNIANLTSQEQSLKQQITQETLMRREALINLNRLDFQLIDSERQINGYQEALKTATQEVASIKTLSAAQGKEFLSAEEQAISALLKEKMALEEKFGVLEKQVADENLVERGMKGEADAITQLEAIGIKRKEIEDQIYVTEIKLKDAIERYYMTFSTVPGVGQPRGARTVGPFTPVALGPQTVGPTTPMPKVVGPATKITLDQLFSGTNILFPSQKAIEDSLKEMKRQNILKNPSKATTPAGLSAYAGSNASQQIADAQNKQIELNRKSMAFTEKSVKNLLKLDLNLTKRIQYEQDLLKKQYKSGASLDKINRTEERIAQLKAEQAVVNERLVNKARGSYITTWDSGTAYSKDKVNPTYNGYNRYSIPLGGSYAPGMNENYATLTQKIHNSISGVGKTITSGLKNAGTAITSGLKNAIPSGIANRVSAGVTAISNKLNKPTPTRYYGDNVNPQLGKWGTIKSGFLTGFGQSGRYAKGAGFWANWAQMGMTGMVNWGEIKKANAGLSRLGKASNILGGAFGSLGMMLGPFEIGMMAISFASQKIQQMQQKYREELEKINSKLSETRENLEKAEEAFLGAYEGQNPKATVEQKDEALLNLYANGPEDRDDGLDSYRDKVYAVLTKIEINTREKAKKQNDFTWGSQGEMAREVWGPWNDAMRDLSLSSPEKDFAREYNEKAQEARQEGMTVERRNSDQLMMSGKDMEKILDNVSNINKYTESLSNYSSWVEDLRESDNYSEQALYSTALMNGGIDSTGITKFNDFFKTYRDFGAKTSMSDNGINSYRAFEASLQNLTQDTKTQIANSINDDPEFYKSMQRQMFTFKDNRLERVEGKEVKILQAISKKAGNITTEQAKQTLILSTLSSIHDFVQNNIQPQLLANVEAGMQSASMLQLTYGTGGYTGNATDAVHQGVMTISAQLVSLIEQRALETMSLLSESSGIKFEDLSQLAHGLTPELALKGYDTEDVKEAEYTMETMKGMYTGVMTTLGYSMEDAKRLTDELYWTNAETGEGLFDVKDGYIPTLPAMMRTYEQWAIPKLTPFIEEEWVKGLQDTTGETSGPTDTDKDKNKDKNKDKDKDKDANRKNWVNLAICNKKEIPKLNVNLFKKPPNFTILNRNFKLRDVNVNTADDAKSIQNAVKNSIIEIQNRSNPKIIQDDAAEYDPLAATDGNTLPTGTKKTE